MILPDAYYTEDDLVAQGITKELIWEGREKQIIIPRRPGMRGYQFKGSEVIQALEEIAPACPMPSKQDRIEKYTTPGTMAARTT